MSITLNEGQTLALEGIRKWRHDPNSPKEIKVSGYAGTGKSTLLGKVHEMGLVDRTLCPTGKAAFELRKKGVTNSETIHSALKVYKGSAITEEGFEIPSFENKEQPLEEDTYIACDEAGMINAQLVRDLRATGRSILWIGDGMQLEPIGENPDILARPDFALTEVVRQSGQSGVLRLATHLREKHWLTGFDGWGDEVLSYQFKNERQALSIAKEHGAELCIVAYNTTRRTVNRLEAGLESHETLRLPVVGDTLVVLQNDYKRELWNGERVTVVEDGIQSTKSRDVCVVRVKRFPEERESTRLRIYKPDLFSEKKLALEDHQVEPHYSPRDITRADFASAITAHKSQGGEYDCVAVFIPKKFAPGWNPTRWVYTAVTRARRKLILFSH